MLGRKDDDMDAEVLYDTGNLYTISYAVIY